MATFALNRLLQIKTEFDKFGVGIADNHCHTEFAYCAEDITIKSALKKAELLGLDHICFTEHAAQLYLSAKDYWSGRFFSQLNSIKNTGNSGVNRMESYRRKFLKVGSPLGKIGLEVEVDRNGKLALLPEDENGWDLLIGALHYLPLEDLNGGTRQLHRRFLWACESLFKNGVDVLAHPFRFFRRHNLPASRTLYRPLVQMLKELKVAAELNFHTDEPGLDFFRICLAEGVKISLGTDSHNMLEVADFSAHFEFLKKLGPNNFKGILWNPTRKTSRTSYRYSNRTKQTWQLQ